MNNYQEQAKWHFSRDNYVQAAQFYEQAIELEPEIKLNYWYLGLSLLLQGDEAEAQTIWLFALAEGEANQLENWTQELTTILKQEAVKFTDKQDYQNGWLIRQHIQEIQPDYLENLLNVILLSIDIELFDNENESLTQLIHLLETLEPEKTNLDLLLEVLDKILASYPLHLEAIRFTERCIAIANYFPTEYQKTTNLLFNRTASIVEKYPPNIAIKFVEICYQIQPENISILATLANLHQDMANFLESINFAKKIIQHSEEIEDRIAANYLIFRGLMKAGGKWEQAKQAHQEYQILVKQLIASQTNLDENHTLALLVTPVAEPYFRDSPQSNHQFRNQIAQFCQSKIQNYFRQTSVLFPDRLPKKPSRNKTLKIGYISSCLRRHSVGWLSRWLFQHHNLEHFQIYAYSLHNDRDRIQEKIVKQVTKFSQFPKSQSISEIAESIYQEKIDILIDLDSITNREVCGVMALQPAPIQITWLGTDASGIPAIDYFIADPYVLPESASEYYTAKIWRLPNTYIAVDGFEIGVPTLRRDELDIAEDAVIYLSAQTGYKRHPHTARLQMKIIKEVPNSYFLIKGLADEESIKKFFTQIAIEEGVEVERLRFLPKVASEEIHRANLGIADIVLDTYPYNGATTTLETLWMGIPLVTRVGEQFAARNSYTMLKNVGVEAGIAWSDEEYLEWGIRLGKDAALRQQVAWQLRRSRQTSPLWDAKQFTREMEQAYEQMWQQYNSST